nr:retrovirus-related Pol polyprotein from transposon TNT 1-94 [Tanacetum cinerariifolium]
MFDDKEMIQFKVLMALVDDELAVRKYHARNGKWIDITMRKVNILLSIDEYVDWKSYLKYINKDLKFVEQQRIRTSNTLTSTKKSSGRFSSSEVMSLTYQEHSPKKRPGLGTKKHTKPETQESSKDHITSGHKVSVASLKNSKNYKALPYQYASPSKQILKAKAKPFSPCIHSGLNDHHPDDCQIFGAVLVCGAVSAHPYNQVKKTYHVTFDESIEAIRFTNTSVDEIKIKDSSRYPLDEFLHEDDPSRQYQSNTDISYYMTPHNLSLIELTKITHVSEVITLNVQNTPLSEDVEGHPDLINTERTHEQIVHNEQNNSQPTKEHSGNNIETSVSITELSAPEITHSQITHHAPTSSHPSPQDIWSRDQHIKLMNIIGKPTQGMRTKSMAAKLTAASAKKVIVEKSVISIFFSFSINQLLKKKKLGISRWGVRQSECLFADFLSAIEPKKVSEALKHPWWVDAMQEELNQFNRNKVLGGNKSSIDQLNSTQQMMVFISVLGPKYSSRYRGKQTPVVKGSPSTQPKDSTRKSKLLPEGKTIDPNDLEGNKQPADKGFLSTSDEGICKSQHLSEGTHTSHPLPEGALTDLKDSRRHIQLTNWGLPSTNIICQSGADTKYHVDKTQSTRFEVLDPNHNKVKTSSEDGEDMDDPFLLPTTEETHPPPSTEQPSTESPHDEPTSTEHQSSSSDKAHLESCKAKKHKKSEELLKPSNYKSSLASLASLPYDNYMSVTKRVLTNLKEVQDAVKEDPALNKKVLEAVKAYTKNSSTPIELLTLVKDLDFTSIKVNPFCSKPEPSSKKKADERKETHSHIEGEQADMVTEEHEEEKVTEEKPKVTQPEPIHTVIPTTPYPTTSITPEAQVIELTAQPVPRVGRSSSTPKLTREGEPMTSLSNKYEILKKILEELGLDLSLPIHKQDPSIPRRKRKEIELEPETYIVGLHCHKELPGGVKLVNNLMIEELEHGLFFIDAFGDEAF